jgi:hypothetical protein
MMINLTQEECGYIGALALFFRTVVKEKDATEIARNLMIIEYEGVGQILLQKIKDALESESKGDASYHG